MQKPARKRNRPISAGYGGNVCSNSNEHKEQSYSICNESPVSLGPQCVTGTDRAFQSPRLQQGYATVTGDL